MIGLVRLLLRGLLLMLLLLTIAGGWVATGFTERMFFVGAGAVLIAGIYFLGRLKSLDGLMVDAPPVQHLPASRMQTQELARLWSAQTPFHVDDPHTRRRASEEPPWYAPLYPIPAPGFHLLALRFLPPVAAFCVSAVFWALLFTFWEPIYAAARDRFGLNTGEVFEAWTFLTILLFVLAMVPVHIFIRHRVPARCIEPHCGGPAYLIEQPAGPLYQPGERMWFYVCRGHRHVNATGVRAVFLHVKH